MTTRAILPLAAIAILAGTGQAQQAPPGPLKSCVPANPKLEWAIWPTAETSSSYADIASFERRLRTAPETSHPALLMQIGRLKARPRTLDRRGAAP